MTDAELLKLAAVAAGKPHEYNTFWNGLYIKRRDASGEYWDSSSLWNPLNNNGDALELAVALGLTVCTNCTDEYSAKFTACFKYNDLGLEVCSVRQDHGDDAMAATRRAIVVAAAEIGKVESPLATR